MRMSRQFDENIEAIDPLETMPPAKKSMVIFFLVDTSKSMEGSKLESLNRVMGDILPELIGVGEAGTDVKVAVMSFSSGCEWITPEPVLIEEYQRWENLRADGVTDLGDACEELCQKLSRNSFLRAPSLSYAPVIFLMTDGYPTDNYKKGFEMLKKNRWFQYGLKIALAIGSNVDLDVLREFTDDEELVLQACGAEMLKKLVREIAVTSSKIGSTSMTLTDATGERSLAEVAGAKKEQMVEAVQEMKQQILGKGIGCQDSSGTVVTDKFAIAVVADGHGSAKHFRSDVGSRIAVKITTKLLKNYMNRPDFKEQFFKHPEFILAQMEKQILMKWREAVEEYHLENPLTEEEENKIPEKAKGKLRTAVIYGSTVLAAVLTKDFSYGMILGDGGFVVLGGDKELYIPLEDKNSHANYTSSLCNTDAIHFFEHWYTTETVKALFVSTDGLFKSFASEEDFLKYHGLLSHMFHDTEKMQKSLKRNFEKRTREGSGDDISIAFVYQEGEEAE